MNQPTPVEKTGKSRILVAPLDWGLGHATRCIPIIRELTDQGAEVILAGEGAQESLLKMEFPHLPFLPLEGYRIRYGRSGPSLLRNILYQTPKILQAIKKENAWLKQAVRDHGINAVISDNRYGLHHPGIPCIFITHQLTIKTPWGKWTDGLLQKRNYSYIEKFSACWVPDAPGSESLAGELSHPRRRPRIPVSYLGILSRFRPVNEMEELGRILVLISGPEPQRTIFENIIVDQLAHSNLSVTVVRGMPGNEQLIPSGNGVTFFNHLPAEELASEIAKADLVIARSGYSSVMDLARMRKKTILVPTPGQTEQEYLARYLAEKKMAFAVEQDNLSLTKHIPEAETCGYRLSESSGTNELNSAIAKLMKQCLI